MKLVEQLKLSGGVESIALRHGDGKSWHRACRM